MVRHRRCGGWKQPWTFHSDGLLCSNYRGNVLVGIPVPYPGTRPAHVSHLEMSNRRVASPQWETHNSRNTAAPLATLTVHPHRDIQVNQLPTNAASHHCRWRQETDKGSVSENGRTLRKMVMVGALTCLPFAHTDRIQKIDGGLE